MSRVNTSPPPPGPSGMMIFTGRDGHSCAGAVAAPHNHAANTNQARENSGHGVVSSPVCCAIIAQDKESAR
jgi:hypothetical protein